jgi:hypothetical protein
MPFATLPVPATINRLARLSSLGAAGRLASYRAGNFDRADVAAWAAHFPEEIPTVNGEVEWIACKLADLD